jgi:hypothetical protein
MDNPFEGIFEERFFENKETFDEILLRLVLLLGLGTKKKKGIKDMSITVKVTDTILPFTDLFEPEAFHVYDLSLDINSNSLNLLLQIIDDNDFMIVRSLNSVKPYFNLIFSFDYKNSKQIGFEIKDAIVGWKSYFKHAASISLIPDRYVAQIDLSVKPVLEINRDSEFIKLTDPLINKLKNELRRPIDRRFMKIFGIKSDQMVLLVDQIHKNNTSGIREFLEANFPYNLFKLDLILRNIDFPDLDIIDLDEYEMHFDEELISRMLRLDREEMITTITKFNELVVDVVDFDHDYNPNTLLQGCLTGSI